MKKEKEARRKKEWKGNAPSKMKKCVGKKCKRQTIWVIIFAFRIRWIRETICHFDCSFAVDALQTAGADTESRKREMRERRKIEHARI